MAHANTIDQTKGRAMGDTPDRNLDLPAANEPLRKMSASERVQWAAARFGMDAVLLSSMQKTSSVLMHIFHRLGLAQEILLVDTGFHFPETLGVRDEFQRRYGLNFVTLLPERTPEQQEKDYGKQLYQFVDGQPLCCNLRKEAPFLRHMREHGRQLVMVGLLAAEGGRRRKLEPLTRDPRFDGYALHPLFDWDEGRVAEYLREHQVPVHPLHAQGYPSIGCQTCTTPVKPGEDARAGRWRHLREPGANGPQYCGLNFSDGSGI